MSFSELMSSVEQMQDDEFGEVVTITPYTQSEYFVGVQSEARYTLVAIVDDDTQHLAATGTRYKGKVDATIVGSNAVMSVSVDQFQSKPTPKQGWRMTRQVRGTTVGYAIKSLRQDGASRLHVYLERDSVK